MMENKRKRTFKRARAISTLMATILMIVVTLVAGLAVMGYTLGWFRTTQVATLDASQTRVYVDLGTGKGMLIMTIKNTGTGDARIANVEIFGETTATITFTAGPKPTIAWGTKTLDGNFTGSTGVGLDPSNNLVIPAGGQVSLRFNFDGSTNKITDVFNVGVRYRAVINPPAGGGAATDFTITPEGY